MDKFDKEFVMHMFLDTDCTTTMNRLVVAIANVVSENSENVNKFTELINKEKFFKDIGPPACSSNSSHGRRKRKYYEENVRNFTDAEYLEHFKMRKNTVQALINFLQDAMKPVATIVPFEKKVHVFLWVLISDSSYSEVGALFGLHKSSVSYIFHEIASLLAEQRYNIITWPSIEEQNATRVKVNTFFKFPNCVGFIDSCRFKVGSKRNKKDKPDIILLQAVCNESLAFLDIHVGEIGNAKKNKLFRESLLSQELKNFIEFDNHILGDSEYKLKINLITPFSSEEVLTCEEMRFNEVHWRACSYISHAFELLKERFRKLSHIDINKPEAVKTLLCAACVLHNFVLLHEGIPQVKDEPIICDESVTFDSKIVTNAEEKRQFLCNYINYIDTT